MMRDPAARPAQDYPMTDCPLCATDGGLLLLKTPLWRLVRVTDTPAHPAFYRVILSRHGAEMSELSRDERVALMEAVNTVETVMRQVLRPTKINLASLGNVVPHLHWHVIARFADDAQWPAPIWASAVRERDTRTTLEQLPALDAALQTAFASA
jgi:diadenosine tetraphosphate (Ap4A) HIT family hydrolase